jgi:hypothetical protein
MYDVLLDDIKKDFNVGEWYSVVYVKDVLKKLIKKHNISFGVAAKNLAFFANVDSIVMDIEGAKVSYFRIIKYKEEFLSSNLPYTKNAYVRWHTVNV